LPGTIPPLSSPRSRGSGRLEDRLQHRQAAQRSGQCAANIRKTQRSRHATGRLSYLGAPLPVPLHHRACWAQMKNGLSKRLDERRSSGHDHCPLFVRNVAGANIASQDAILNHASRRL
jgi:hypothetical protein